MTPTERKLLEQCAFIAENSVYTPYAGEDGKEIAARQRAFIARRIRALLAEKPG